jgi:chromosome segregation ATPase
MENENSVPVISNDADTNDTIINELNNDNLNTSEIPMIDFLNDVVVKSKRLGHNKFQNQIEIYIKQIQGYENDNLNFKNTIDQLSKENKLIIESNEKQKNELVTMTNNYDELLKKFNDINITLSNEKATNNNVKLAYENQLQRINKQNETLNVDLANEKKMNADNQEKFNELKSRYDELTGMYSKQTFDIDVLNKELKNAKDELNMAYSNNKSLHDELNNIKNEVSDYLNMINDLKTQLELQQPTKTLLNSFDLNNQQKSKPQYRGIKPSSRK